MRVTVHLVAAMLFCGGWLSAAAPAETIESQWTEAAHTLARQICAVEPTDAHEALELVPLRSFGISSSSRPIALLAQTSGSRIISVRAYPGLTGNIADNLARDFAASDLPEPIKRLFIPPTPEQMRQANVLAARWCRESLRLTRQAPIAMIVLWRGDNALPTLAVDSYKNHVVFVLIRGQVTEAGQIRIAEIVFGNPLLGGM